ncbi:hypothetical protein [Bosea sp. BH3]|uniref:hypothetical protein n=1 Tax=Bosea sp. BH3 TaxID=2871701 RepID=UPI0021CB518B|nr:hypothetical protein [Bosea sp. BH3]MCU4180188.1 hypothetical protein [Bosea sp. BH3]
MIWVVRIRTLYDPPNVPVRGGLTNHLHIGSKEMLTDAPASLEGTTLFVSHGRQGVALPGPTELNLTRTLRLPMCLVVRDGRPAAAAAPH